MSIRRNVDTRRRNYFRFARGLALGVIVMLATTAMAQQEDGDMEDVLLLKTAEVVRGDIVEQYVDTIAIRLHNDSIRHVPTEEIERVLRMKKTPRRHQTSAGQEAASYPKSADDQEHSGFAPIIGVGMGTNFDEDESTTFKVNIIFGFAVEGIASFGVGTGVRAVTEREALTVPLYFDLRSALLRSNVAPYIAAGGGMGWLVNQKVYNNENASFAYVHLGVRFKKAGRTAAHIGLSYEMVPTYVEVDTDRSGRVPGFSAQRDELGVYGLELAISF